MPWWRSKTEESKTKLLALSCQSPYEAMFGVREKRGIASSFLPGKRIANIETEKQLEEITNTFETKEQLVLNWGGENTNLQHVQH